jgi:hypothetical protein
MNLANDMSSLVLKATLFVWYVAQWRSQATHLTLLLKGLYVGGR